MGSPVPDSPALQPQVSLSVNGQVIEASWPAVPGAFAYLVAVTDAAGAPVHQAEIPAADLEPPVPLEFDAVPGHAYTVRVRIAGPPSDPRTVTIPDASADLRERLVADGATVAPAEGGGWTARPPAGWDLSDTFPELTETPFAYLPLADPVFTARDGSLRFDATLLISRDLRPGRDPAAIRVPISGPVTVVPGQAPTLTWSAGSAPGALSIPRLGQPPLTFEAASLALSYDAGREPAAVLTLTGKAAFGGTPVTCTVELPTVVTPGIVLKTSTDLAPDRTAAALAATGIDDVFGTRLPADVLGLAGVVVSAVEVSSPAHGPTSTTVTLRFGAGTWAPAPGMSVTGLEATLTVLRAPGLVFGGELRGTILLGQRPYRLRAGIPAQGPWYVEFTGTLPTFTELAQLAGFGTRDATDALPRDLPATGAPSRIALRVSDGALIGVSCTLAQSADWVVVPDHLTVSGWAVDLELRKGASWTASGVVRGSALVGESGGAAFDAALPFPAQAGAPWLLSLDTERPIRLPSLSQALALFGAGSPLPAGMAELTGPQITRLAIGMDPTTMAVTGLGMAFAQPEGEWKIFEGLAVRELAGSLVLDTEASDVQGHGRGAVLLCGRSVDIAAVKDPEVPGWMLFIAQNGPVHIPGLDALDSWLAPGGGALPAGLPLTKGADLSEVRVIFAADGSVAWFGFSLDVPDVWTILPGRLALTSLIARAQVAVPVSAATTVGTVIALLTIGGATIEVGAEHPAPNAPWVFTGRLRAGDAMDLLGAAAQLSPSGAAVPALPHDAGLPAAVTLTALDIRAVPETGELHLSGSAGLDWRVPFGARELILGSVGGSLDVPGRDKPVRGVLTATLRYPGVQAEVSLVLDGRALLSGVLTPVEAAGASLAQLTGGGWAALAPAALAAPAFDTAAVQLNLTDGRMLLYGRLGTGTAFAADTLVYLDTTGSYAVALRLGPAFRFAMILPADWHLDDRLQATDVRVVACDLPGTTFGRLAQTAEQELHAVAPDVRAPLAGLATDKELSKGFSLVARIDLLRPILFARIIQIGSADGPSALWLTALVDRADPARTVFTADLPDITLGGTVVLTHDDAHPHGLHLSYQPGHGDRFELAGRIRIHALFGTDFAFDVGLTVDDTGLVTRARQGTEAIDKPFGLPLRLSGIAVDYACRWAVPPAAPRTCALSLRGRVLLGPAPKAGERDARLDCAGMLVVRDGSPVLFETVLAADWSLGAFAAQCLTGSAASWPGDTVELTLRKDSRIYYAAAASDGHAAGFTIDARLTVTLLTPIDLHGTVSVRRDPTTGAYDGITAAIALDHPLDLGFLAFAGSSRDARGPFKGGPTLNVSTGTAVAVGLGAGINFLGEAFATVAVAVSARADGGRQLRGRLTAARELAPFGRLDCAFRYTTHPGRASEFSIEDWPAFTWAAELINLVGAIKSLAGAGSRCGTLTGFVVRNSYSSTYTVTPSVVLDGGALKFTLTGTMALSMAGIEFVTMDFPAFTVSVPSTTRFDNLPSVLAEGFASGSAGVASALLRDPVKAAIFLALVAGPDAADIVRVLLCEGLVDGAAVVATDAAVAALTGTGTVIGAALIALLAGIVQAAVAKHGDEPATPPDDPAPAAPTLRSVSFDGTRVEATWTEMSRASGYTFVLTDPSGREVVTQKLGLVGSTRFALEGDALVPGTYQVTVRAVRGMVTGPWSAAAPLTVPEEPMPAITGVSRLADTYTITWTSTLHLFDVQLTAGNRVLAATSTASSQAVLNATLRDFAHCRIKVRAHSPRGVSRWAIRQFPVLTVPPPTSVFLGEADGRFFVTWNPMPVAGRPAVRYTAELLDMSHPDQPLVTVTDITGARADLPYDESHLPPTGIELSVRLRADIGGNLSIWASSQTLKWIPLAEPVDPQLTIDGTTLRLTWVGSPPGCEVTLLCNGSDVGTATLAAPGEVHRADNRRPEPEEQYRARLRAVGYGRTGRWLVTPPVDVLGQIDGFTASYASDQIALTWIPSTILGVTYALSITSTRPGSTPSVTDLPQPFVFTSPLTADYDTSALPRGTYLLQIRAHASGTTGPWSQPVAVSLLDPPTSIEVESDGTRVTARWAQAPLAEGYHIALIDAQGTLLQSMSTTRTAATLTMTGPALTTRHRALRVSSLRGATSSAPSSPTPIPD